MIRENAIFIENQLTEKLKVKFSDIKTHVDFIYGTDKMVISFFWNRISQERWGNYKSFTFNSINYRSILNSEIIPFFN